MGVDHGRSRLLDLSFHIASCVIHPDWLRTLAYFRIGKGEWEADIRIIEGGHAINFRYQHVRISEVLLSLQDTLPENGILRKSAISDECSMSYRLEGIVDYHMSCEIERVSDQVFRQLDQEMTLDTAPDDLFFRFASLNRLAPPPLSRIHFEPMQRGFAVHVYHTFPAENAILRSQALFEPVTLHSSKNASQGDT